MAQRERPAHVDDDRYAGALARGGYRQVPNKIIDAYCVLINRYGTANAGWIFLKIWRETCGRNYTRAFLSVRYLAKGTGLSRGQVERALEWLCEAGFIEQEKFPAAEAKLNNPISRWRHEYRVAPKILRFIYRLVDDDDDVAPEPTILDPELWVSEPMMEFLYPSQGRPAGETGRPAGETRVVPPVRQRDNLKRQPNQRQ